MTRESQRQDPYDDRGTGDVLQEHYAPPQRRPGRQDAGTADGEMRVNETLDRPIEEDVPVADAMEQNENLDGSLAEGTTTSERAGRIGSADDSAATEPEDERRV